MNQEPLPQRVIAWLLSDHTGVSSKAIVEHMLDVKIEGGRMSPPWDAADRQRCILLLQTVPEWIERLPEMTKYDNVENTGIVVDSTGLRADTNTWEKQIPLIIEQGNLA